MPASTDIHALLAQADWLRRLARQLVASDEDAQDAVQETWVAALRTPPDPRRPARPWLAAVLRNFVFKSARRTRVRRARDAELVPDGSAASPEELLASVEVQRLLVDLVLALDEPYRTAILLRHYQGREPASIAQELGIPVGTLRWRLSEGLGRLRAALDDRLANRGTSWRRALAPALLDRSRTKGALLVMTTKTKAALVVAGAVVALLGGRLAWHRIARAGVADRGSNAATAGGLGLDTRGAARAPEGVAKPAASVGVGAESSQRPAPPRFVVAAESAEGAASVPSDGQRGTMSKDDIRAGIRSIVPGIKACYAQLLEREPNVSGHVDIKFTIVDREGVGRISEATIEPRERDGGVPELVAPLTEQCIVKAVSDAQFVAPVGGPVVVVYPFLLTPSHVPAPRPE